MDSSISTIRQCCGTIKLFHEDSYEVLRVHCLPRSSHMLSIPPLSVSRLHNLRKVGRTEVCIINSEQEPLAGFILTHFCMICLVSTTLTEKI